MKKFLILLALLLSFQLWAFSPVCINNNSHPPGCAGDLIRVGKLVAHLNQKDGTTCMGPAPVLFPDDAKLKAFNLKCDQWKACLMVEAVQFCKQFVHGAVPANSNTHQPVPVQGVGTTPPPPPPRSQGVGIIPPPPPPRSTVPSTPNVEPSVTCSQPGVPSSCTNFFENYNNQSFKPHIQRCGQPMQFNEKNCRDYKACLVSKMSSKKFCDDKVVTCEVKPPAPASCSNFWNNYENSSVASNEARCTLPPIFTSASCSIYHACIRKKLRSRVFCNVKVESVKKTKSGGFKTNFNR